MSALSDHQAAQAATAAARDTLASLNARIESGDASVTGADLLAAEAQVHVAERLERGAWARAQEEQEHSEAEAKERAIADFIASYEAGRAAVADKLDVALRSLSDLAQEVATLQSTTRIGRTRAGLTGPGIPGYGHTPAPDPLEVIEGIEELVRRKFGLPSTVTHPHVVWEPLLPFLRQGVPS
jgi:hypothetical protein